MADPKPSAVTYRGDDRGRFGAYELESNRKKWTFPKDRKVEDVPETVVKALRSVEGHKFDIKEG